MATMESGHGNGIWLIPKVPNTCTLFIADGVKFSVRSERPDVDAGKLVSEALFGLGRGGGHATMAGGFVPAEMFSSLGPYKSNAINERFINAMKTIQEYI